MAGGRGGGGSANLSVLGGYIGAEATYDQEGGGEERTERWEG